MIDVLLPHHDSTQCDTLVSQCYSYLRRWN